MKCANCSTPISFKKLVILTKENIYSIVCPNCKTTLYAKNSSILLFFTILIFVIFILGSLHVNLFLKGGLIIFWICTTYLLIQPLVFKYTIQK